MSTTMMPLFEHVEQAPPVPAPAPNVKIADPHHAGLNGDVSTKTWDNRSGPRSATNTAWSLTHSLEQARRG